jgi:hypothetical protein
MSYTTKLFATTIPLHANIDQVDLGKRRLSQNGPGGEQIHWQIRTLSSGHLPVPTQPPNGANLTLCTVARGVQEQKIPRTQLRPMQFVKP